MKAGRMRSVIEVWKPQTERNEYGEKARRWESAGKIRAERVSLTGRRSEEADEHFADYSARYNVRIAHHIEANWQITGDDGLRYTIVAVEPCRWLGMQTLRCERLNE